MTNLYHGTLSAPRGCVGVIMAGGSGTRFWPASRQSRPKQFLSLADDSLSLIQSTAQRLYPLCDRAGVLVVGGVSQRELIAQHLPGVAMLLEPIPRNTAPCVGYAAALVLKTVGDVPMVCVPADHIVHGTKELEAVLRIAIEHAAAYPELITIGIAPSSPETGYGYIRVAGESPEPVKKVEQFVEKPALETAKSYLKSGHYFWNSGIFVWRPSVILAAIERALPQLGKACQVMGKSFGTPDEAGAIGDVFSSIDPISIDVGVMEQSVNVSMVPGVGFQWSDVGSWSAWLECLAQEGARDKDLNLLRGPSIVVDSQNCAVLADKRLVALVGVEDIIVIETADSILVCHRDKTQDVKRVVDELRRTGREDLL